jgi:hypothetical protein
VTLVTEMLLVSGVALDLVGAGVLSHAHNAESIAELREDIGEEGAAVGGARRALHPCPAVGRETDRLSTLNPGAGSLPERSRPEEPRGPGDDGVHRGGVVMAGLVISVVFTRVVGNRIRDQARRAIEQQDPDALPEQ